MAFLSTESALDLLYDGQVKRKKCTHPQAETMGRLQQALANAGDACRPNNGLRYQAQIILTRAWSDGRDESDCVLRVLDNAEIAPFLAFMMDHRRGLEGLRSEREHVSPLFLPERMQKDAGMGLLNAILQVIYTCRRDNAPPQWSPRDITLAQFEAFIQRVLRNWDELRMPAECPRVSVVVPDARVGALVIWKHVHGNCGAPDPPTACASLFVDFAPRETFSPAHRAQSSLAMQHRPWQYGAGAISCRHAGYNNLTNQMHGRPGGLERLGAALTDTHRYLAGDDSLPVPPIGEAGVLTAEQRQQLDRRGYLVLSAEFMQRICPQWQQCIADARADLAEHMTDLIVRRGKLADQTPLSFDNPLDPRWKAVGGSRGDAKRAFGDEYAMYAMNERDERARDARSGGSLLTRQSGMGAATNLYDSPAQMLLQFGCYPLFAELYGTRELMWLPERFRVRTNRDGELPLHTDTCIPLPAEK